MYSFSTLGPALGYVIGGQLLNLYVDFYEVERQVSALNNNRSIFFAIFFILKHSSKKLNLYDIKTINNCLILIFFFSVSITPNDPRWVGAWWVGFVVASLLFLVVSIPLFGYGKELPSKFLLRLQIYYIINFG